MKVKMQLVDDNDNVLESSSIPLTEISQMKALYNMNLTVEVLGQMIESYKTKKFRGEKGADDNIKGVDNLHEI